MRGYMRSGTTDTAATSTSWGAGLGRHPDQAAGRLVRPELLGVQPGYGVEAPAELLHVHRRLHHVLPPGAIRFQDAVEIGEGRADLDLEIVVADDVCFPSWES